MQSNVAPTPAPKRKQTAQAPSGDSVLDAKIKAYSKNRQIIKVLLWAFLACSLSYLAYIFFKSKNTGYKEILKEGYNLQGVIASSTDGKTVLLAAKKDSVYKLLYSEDAGVHFENMGEWSMQKELNKIHLAPDNESVFVLAGNSIYYSKKGTIGVRKIPVIKGLNFFIKGAYIDSSANVIYVYGEWSQILGINLTTLEQTLYEVQGFDEIVSLAKGAGEFKAIAFKDNEPYLLEGTSLAAIKATRFNEETHRDSSKHYDQSQYQKNNPAFTDSSSNDKKKSLAK